MTSVVETAWCCSRDRLGSMKDGMLRDMARAIDAELQALKPTLLRSGFLCCT